MTNQCTTMALKSPEHPHRLELRNIVQYRICYAHSISLADDEDGINILISKGWQPYGHPIWAGDVTVQVMVKFEERASSAELERAIKIAGQVLDRVNADPDDEIAIISRQLLRLIEKI